MTGATPFPDESDEEIVGRVVRGQRPEWPSANPPQGLTKALSEQIKSCWKQEPKERPAASSVLEALLALDKVYQGDDAVNGVWGYVGDDLKEGMFVGSYITLGLTLCWFTVIQRIREYKSRKQYLRLGNLSDSEPSFSAGLKTPHPNRIRHVKTYPGDAQNFNQECI